jgi:hypothetical protein
MRLVVIAALAIALSTGCLAQDAVVVELSKCDADQAKKLYEAKKKADAEYDALTERIGREHQLPSFEFSKDFRFIVPVSKWPNAANCCPNSGTLCLTNIWNCGTNLYVTPAGAGPAIGGTFTFSGATDPGSLIVK